MKMVLCSLLEKLLKEYENHHSPLYFEFKKIKEHYVFTDVNQALLQTINRQRADFIGQTLETAPHLGDKATRTKLKTIYPLAWSGKKVIFYGFPAANMDIFMITYLEPQYAKGEVVQVRGRCASFDKNELPDVAQHTKEFVTFEIS
ncbi:MULTISPECIES: hypothetical protein [Bacillus]|uniref:Uncharacterized protein n=1 Tax=Bacillus cereus TaxID=1396 RepID=A0A9X6GCN7_BACCE|nr:hypothetical protein [Bacillus cereus]OOR71102.1 hypothetical protein BLX06_32690 [Bacillus cereus]